MAKRKISNVSVVVIPSVARDLCDGEFHHLFIFAITEIPRFARNDSWESSNDGWVAFGMTTKTGMKSIVIASAAKRRLATSVLLSSRAQRGISVTGSSTIYSYSLLQRFLASLGMTVGRARNRSWEGSESQLGGLGMTVKKRNVMGLQSELSR